MNNRGVTIVGVVVGMALAGLLSLVISQLFSNSFRMQHRLNDNVEAGNQLGVYKMILETPENCHASFIAGRDPWIVNSENMSIDFPRDTQIQIAKKPDNKIISSIGGEIRPGLVLDGIQLSLVDQYKESASHVFFLGRLIFQFRRKEQVVARELPLSVGVYKQTGAMMSCATEKTGDEPEKKHLPASTDDPWLTPDFEQGSTCEPGGSVEASSCNKKPDSAGKFPPSTICAKAGAKPDGNEYFFCFNGHWKKL